MRSALERAQSLLSWIAARPAGRKLYHAIPGDHIKDDPDSSLVGATLFEPENSYYSVRIVELHLQNAGEYFRNFLPMLLTLSEFNRGGEATTHPYFVSNERLKDALGSSGANIGAVQIQDVYALRLCPANSEDLSLFCGLFRVVRHDFAAALLDLLADLGGKVGGAAVAQGAELGQALYSRLGQIFGMKDVEFRFGHLDGSALKGGSGYRMFAGAMEDQVNLDALWMVGGKLCWREANGTFRRVNEFDYCVVAIEHLSSRATLGLLTTLPIHQHWKAIVPSLTSKRLDEAEAGFQKLQGEILLTPDLTEADRLVALTTYQKRWTDIVDAVSAGPRAGDATRTRGASTTFLKALREEERSYRTRGQAEAAAAASILWDRIFDGPAPATSSADLLEIGQEAQDIQVAFKGMVPAAGASADLAALLTTARARSAVFHA